MNQFYIHQIYYDEHTRAQLDPGYMALDNTANLRPDWYEFWVIKNYLENQTLDEHGFYAFLSPKFVAKTGLSSAHLLKLLAQVQTVSDVVLVNVAWDQIAYFKNPFEQGEFWHPGITRLSQQVLTALGVAVNIDDLICHTHNFTFCNYVIARPVYWRAWYALAQSLFCYIEQSSGELQAHTTYGNTNHHAPMKTFIQERLPAIVLQQQSFRISVIEDAVNFPIMSNVFTQNSHTRGLLQTCNLLKQQYLKTGNRQQLQAYQQVRELITLPRMARSVSD